MKKRTFIFDFPIDHHLQRSLIRRRVHYVQTGTGLISCCWFRVSEGGGAGGGGVIAIALEVA